MPNTPLPIQVPVTVNKDTTPYTLVVHGNGANSNDIEVSQNTLMQIIQWNLDLAAGDTGTFNTIDPQSPATSGFDWTCDPAPGPTIFNGYSEPGGTEIHVNDMDNSSNKGDWTYKLRATVNGHPCETNPPSAGGEPGDPSIKNN